MQKSQRSSFILCCRRYINRVMAFLVLATGILLSACELLSNVADNFPPAATPQLLQLGTTPFATTIDSGLLTSGTVTAVTSCVGRYPLQPGAVLALDILNRSITDIEVTVNGTVLRVPENAAQENQFRNNGTGFYFVDKEFGTRSEGSDTQDDQRVFIILPAATNQIRPLAVEVRGISFSNQTTGVEKRSEPLRVTLQNCPDFTLQTIAIPVVPLGSELNFSINITRMYDFQDPVSLIFENLPSGVIATFQPNPLRINETQSLVNLRVPSTTIQGTRSVNIRADSGSMVRNRSTQLRIIDPSSQAARHNTDCNCGRIGDYVQPVEVEQTTESPVAGFNLTVDPGPSKTSLLLTNNSSCTFSTLVSPEGKWGFSPNNRFFVTSDRSLQFVNRAIITFFEIPTCTNNYYSHITESLFISPGEEGSIAGWGFAPNTKDDTFLVAALTGSQQTAVTLINLEAKTILPVLNINEMEAEFFFSRCGDVFASKRYNNQTNHVEFDFFSTRTGLSIGGASESMAQIDLTNTALFSTATDHKLRIPFVNGQPTVERSVFLNSGSQACQ